LSVERGALSIERGALSVEHGAWSVEHGALSVEHGAWSMEHGAGLPIYIYIYIYIYNAESLTRMGLTLTCAIPVVFGQQYKAVVCMYLYIHTAMNTTILRIVAIYNCNYMFRPCM